MLKIIRRHTEKCKYTKHDPKTGNPIFAGEAVIKCQCPLWVKGKDNYRGVRIRMPLYDWTLRERGAGVDTRDYNAAWNFVREYEAQEGRLQTVGRRATIAEFKEGFMADVADRKLGSETARKHSQLFRQLEAFCVKKGFEYVDQLDTANLRAFRGTWEDEALSASKKLERMRQHFRFALSNNWIQKDPTEGLKAPTVKETPTLPFTDEEMAKIVAVARTFQPERVPKFMVYAFILTMRFSGLRISDVAMLKTDRLQGEHLTLYTAKTGRPVRVLLPPVVVNALKSFPPKVPGYFFWTGESKLTSTTANWRKHLAKVFKAAKIVNGHTHKFRDTFAVDYLAHGGRMEDLSILLGHKSIRITEKHYAPWVPARQDNLDTSVRKMHESRKDWHVFGTVAEKLRKTA